VKPEPTRVHSSLRELTSVRFREFLREPEAVFWTFAFPVLLAIGLGIAFRNKPAEIVHVGIVEGAGADSTIAALRASKALAVEVVPTLDSALASMRNGKIALVVEARGPRAVTYRFDDTRPDARNARLLADDAIQRGAGRVDPTTTSDSLVREAGSRYIDFVIPGLLGMNIMGGSIWGVGFAIVDARRKKLLKRLVATPMSRTEYMMAFVFSRLGMLIAEVAVVLGFAVAVFGVPMRGSLLQLTAVVLLSALAFGGLGLLIASRAQTIEGASGLMNASMVPMWVLSGVFFSSENFPRAFQPFIKALPLTATNDAMRATMLRGETWASIGPEMLVLAIWTVGCAWLALKFFRWR
jgi:ABC-type polysaccharide/polyol phosphate export permease